MKTLNIKWLLFICSFFTCHLSQAQVKIIYATKKDSTTYLIKASFSEMKKKDERIKLVKNEIIKSDGQFDTSKIDNVKEFLDKRYLNFRYTISLRK